MSEPGGPGPEWGAPPPPPGGHTPPPSTPPPSTPPPGAPQGAPPQGAPPPSPGHPPAPGAPQAPGYPQSPGYPPGPGYPAQPYPPQPGYGAQPFGYGTPYPQAPRNEPLAVAGMVCGIAAIPTLFLCGIGIAGGVLGIVFGLIAMRRIRDSGGALSGRGMALAGAICGTVALSLFVIYILVVIVASVADA